MSEPGDIVRSAAGRDRDSYLYVMAREGEFLLLCDGKRRSVRRPKRKKLRHTEMVCRGYDHPVTHKLQQGEAVTDRELRRALAAFKGEMKFGKR